MFGILILHHNPHCFKTITKAKAIGENEPLQYCTPTPAQPCGKMGRGVHVLWKTSEIKKFA
jgi:hypothetical protein